MYSHPCWDLSLLEKNIVPLPYIPKDKIKCGHKYSLTYKEWKLIVECLFKYIMLYLQEGLELKLPHNMGYLQLKKWKSRSLDKLHFVKTGERRWKKHVETGGYKPIIKWKRYNKDAHFRNKSVWKITFVRGQWRKLIEYLQENYSNINKLVDA